MRTIQVSDGGCVEDFNIRANIITYAAAHDSLGDGLSAKHKDQLAVNDVKWSHGNFKTTIATAVPNGQIVVYDINRAGVELARLHEHSRIVHRLGFNPHQAALMLSGSQDATVRLWDLRTLAGGRSAMTCQSRMKFAGNNEGIRDLKWRPTDAFEFAVATDSGVIQRWDIRKDNSPILRVNAHEKTCNSIDWHADGKHLVSGGADKNVKVWDFSSSERRMKHTRHIRTPQAVMNVCWRPACWYSDAQSPGGWQCTQLVTSYDQQDPRIHIWDFRRPHVPFRVLYHFDTSPTALLWHSERLLWSVGWAGVFTQSDMNLAPKAMDLPSPNTLDISPNGRILFFSQKRERRRLSIEDVLEQTIRGKQGQGSLNGQTSRSHSVTDGSHEEPSLLSSSFKNRQRKSASSVRSAKSSAGTPPPAGSGGPVLSLEKSLQEKHLYRPAQVAGIGFIEGLFDADAFKFLARNYRQPRSVTPEGTESNPHLQLSDALKFNSNLAGYTGQYRLAQSWQILAFAAEKELSSRAESNSHLRKYNASVNKSMSRTPEKSTDDDVHDGGRKHDSKSSELLNGQAHTKPIISNTLDNTSNMTTPLARPVPDRPQMPRASETIESLSLPAAPWSKKPVKPLSAVSELAKMTAPASPEKSKNVHQSALLESGDVSAEENLPARYTEHVHLDPDFADMDRQMAERRAAMDTYRAIPRPLLRLDEPSHLTSRGLHLPHMDRHDSDESFQLFSASTDSSHRGQSTIGSLESDQISHKPSSMPEDVQGANGHRVNDGDKHAESALVFDEEALRSPENTLAPPRDMSSTRLEQSSNKPAPLATKMASHRPSDNPQFVINHEDIASSENPKLSVSDSVPERPEYITPDLLPQEAGRADIVPWTATAMFEPLVDFHTYKLHDAQLPAYLILHLLPYLDLCFPYQRAVLILLNYHRQLTSFELYSQATELRNVAHSDYPEVSEHGLYQVTPGGPWCTACQKPNKGTRAKYCERCNQPWGLCPICNGLGPSSVCRSTNLGKTSNENNKNPHASDTLWSWCQACGHGGHVGCLRQWWEDDDSEGACPTLACSCDCMPGTRRDAIVRKFEEVRKPGLVSRDEWTVAESRAVERTRGLVGASRGLDTSRGTAKTQTSSHAGRGAISLGVAGRTGSGGKKVRIVVPRDESDEGASSREAEQIGPSTSAP